MLDFIHRIALLVQTKWNHQHQTVLELFRSDVPGCSFYDVEIQILRGNEDADSYDNGTSMSFVSVPHMIPEIGNVIYIHICMSISFAGRFLRTALPLTVHYFKFMFRYVPIDVPTHKNFRNGTWRPAGEMHFFSGLPHAVNVPL